MYPMIIDVILISLQAYYSLFASFRSYLLHTRRLVLCGLVILLYCLCVFIQTQHSKRAVFYHIAVALIDNKGLSPRLADSDYCGSVV